MRDITSAFIKMAANRKVDDAGKINVYQNIAMEVSAVGGKKNKKKGGK